MKGAVPYYKFRESKTGPDTKPGAEGTGRPDPTRKLLCEMAHHVNNLLMRIQGWTSLMLMDVQEECAGFDRLKMIENHIAYGAVLTAQLLASAGRGVYADPVNIPPLLLASMGDPDIEPGKYASRSNLFIVGYRSEKLCSSLVEVCRNIAVKLTGLFGRIENISMDGVNRKLEKQYARKVCRVTGEGLRIMRSVSTGTIDSRIPFLHRYLDGGTIAGPGVPAQLAGRFSDEHPKRDYNPLY